MNSLNSQLVSATDQSAEAEVGTNAEYGPALEFGTARMAARPFMRPAVDEHEDSVMDAATAVMKILLQESAG